MKTRTLVASLSSVLLLLALLVACNSGGGKKQAIDFVPDFIPPTPLSASVTVNGVQPRTFANETSPEGNEEFYSQAGGNEERLSLATIRQWIFGNSDLQDVGNVNGPFTSGDLITFDGNNFIALDPIDNDNQDLTIAYNNGVEIGLDITNGAGIILDDATTTSAGLMNTGDKIKLDSLFNTRVVAGSNITITGAGDGGDPYVINSTGGGGGGSGEVNTASNIGGGEGLFASKSGVNLQFKSLFAGSGISLSSNANEVTISSTGGGGSVQWYTTTTDNFEIKASSDPTAWITGSNGSYTITVPAGEVLEDINYFPKGSPPNQTLDGSSQTIITINYTGIGAFRLVPGVFIKTSGGNIQPANLGAAPASSITYTGTGIVVSMTGTGGVGNTGAGTVQITNLNAAR
ncbi:MAG: hypothetical protein AAF599_09625 [Bacteroidota bacterium]